MTSDNLYRNTLPANILKRMAASAKALKGTVVIELHGMAENAGVRFWCKDAQGECALYGDVHTDIIPEAGGGPISILVDAMKLHEVISAFDAKTNLAFGLDEDEIENLHLWFEVEGVVHTRRTISVDEDQSEPYDIGDEDHDVIMPLRLTEYGKVLASFKKHTDIMQISVTDDGDFRASYNTRAGSDSYTFTPDGDAVVVPYSGLFNAVLMQVANTACKAISTQGYLSLTEDRPATLHAATDDMSVFVYVVANTEL